MDEATQQNSALVEKKRHGGTAEGRCRLKCEGYFFLDGWRRITIKSGNPHPFIGRCQIRSELRHFSYPDYSPPLPSFTDIKLNLDANLA